jgi:sensor histidine kinase YesM
VTKKEQVPKLVLHTFVENSLKHGIIPKDGGGMVKIIAEIEESYLKLIVEDNGVGFSSSQHNNMNTGKGLKLTKEFYEILNQLNKRPIEHTIADIYDEKGEVTGTRVEVKVPLSDVESPSYKNLDTLRP